MKSSATRYTALVAGMAIASGLALAQPKPASPVADAPSEAAQSRNSVLSNEDRNFIQRAAETGLLEVEASKLAQERAESKEVKSFAQSMIKDHMAANMELQAIAKKKGIELPMSPSDMQKEKLEALSDVEGTDFDRLYAREIGVAAHQEALSLFDGAIAGLQDPELRAFAVKTLPSLKKHLGMAQDLGRGILD